VLRAFLRKTRGLTCPLLHNANTPRPQALPIPVAALILSCSPAVFTCTWYIASRLPEVRGRACAGAASASYVQPGGIYVYVGTSRAGSRRSGVGLAPGPQALPMPAAALVLYIPAAALILYIHVKALIKDA
jgi:hypothetical protein